jgi:hypothetical protein
VGQIGVDMAIKLRRQSTFLIACGGTGLLTGLVFLHASLAVWHVILLTWDALVFSSVILTGIASFRLSMETRRWRKQLEENNRIGEIILQTMKALEEQHENNDSKDNPDRPPVIN